MELLTNLNTLDDTFKNCKFFAFFLPIGGSEQFLELETTFFSTSRYVETPGSISCSLLGKFFLKIIKV
jgi:hypothetical protein